MFSFICLFVFWIGISLLCLGDTGDLRKRAKLYFEKTERKKGVLEKLKAMYFSLKSGLTRDAVIMEISESLGYIRNIAILGRSSEISAQILLYELSDRSDKLKHLFGEMPRYLSTNDKELAARLFEESRIQSVPSGIGELLSYWDDIAPSEVLETVDAYQNILDEIRITAQKRRDEIISDIVYLPVVLNCMIVLLNFVYISFFLEQQNLYMF